MPNKTPPKNTKSSTPSTDFQKFSGFPHLPGFVTREGFPHSPSTWNLPKGPGGSQEVWLDFDVFWGPFFLLKKLAGLPGTLKLTVRKNT